MPWQEFAILEHKKNIGPPQKPMKLSPSVIGREVKDRR
jgi:hypothetical protein